VKILGKPTLELTENEKKGLCGRRSLVAVKEIRKGEIFTPENLRSIRPAIGIKPKYYRELLGKPASQDYRFGQGIDASELER
jgi:N-acetylneuraminate synthase/pseudaminic acid synthase